MAAVFQKVRDAVVERKKKQAEDAAKSTAQKTPAAAAAASQGSGQAEYSLKAKLLGIG